MNRTRIAGIAVTLALGAAVAWLVVPREYRAAVQTYQQTAEPREIILHVSVGPGDAVAGTEVYEDSRKVVVVVRARDANRSKVGSGDSYFVKVRLSEPVGDRVVVDGTDLPGLAGHAVPRVP